MELKSTQFDMTDPFVQLSQRARQAETYLQQLPLTQRQQLMAEMHPPVVVGRPPAFEPAVRMVTAEIGARAGAPTGDYTPPTVVYRPRRLVRPVTWQWRLIVVGIRLIRRLRRLARLQWCEIRRLMRRVIPNPRPMRRTRYR